jgi:predicted small secreted protein
MKKIYIALLLAGSILLAGCSALEGVNNTLNYAAEASEYANEATAFGKEIPDLAKRAVNDEQAAQELETQLEEMKTNIEEFNKLEAPEVAANLHQQVVNQNNRAIEGIDLYLDNIENGKLNSEVLKNTQALESLQEITSIVEQIKQLGN